MHWYGGSIVEAVSLSKQRNAIFVVFVEGDNDLSVEMASTIEESAIVSRLSNPTNFLAIKLKSGTPNYTHFAKIYQFVPVPSLFFIGRNGTPLEVVCAGVQTDSLADRLDRILAEHHKEKPPSSTAPLASPSSSNIRAQTASLLQSEAAHSVPVEHHQPAEEALDKENDETSAPPAKMAKTDNFEIVCDGDVCIRRPKVDPGASTSSLAADIPNSAVPVVAQSPSSDSIEQKMERAKELIEARKREKAAKEKELERQKELERRNAGQGVAELKRWQADQELKNIQEERKREKLENNLARQRILEQIAQDRAERKARETAAPPPVALPPVQQSVQPQPTAGDAHGTARIQLKLPDGSSHTASFDADSTLAALHTYVTDNLQLSSNNFALWTAFPRRELVEVEATLRSLQLAPSAALLVLPRRTGSVPMPTSFSVITFVTQLLTSLVYDPSMRLLQWLRARFSPPPAVGRAPSPSAPRAPAAGPVRRRGNIHKLPGDAPDDDNNTWNGNSTQQM